MTGGSGTDFCDGGDSTGTNEAKDCETTTGVP